MKQLAASADRWESCSGEVDYLVRHLRHRRRSATMQRGIAVASMLLLGLSTSFLHVVVMADVDMPVGTVTCKRVVEGFKQFFAGELDKESNQQVHQHLDHCRWCRAQLTEHLRVNQYGDPVTLAPPVKAEEATINSLTK